MYKLHYDVDAGDQLNVLYKGVEFDIQAGIGGDVEVETNKTVTLTSNGVHEIVPSIDKDVMAKVTATVNVPSPVQDAVWFGSKPSTTIDGVGGGSYKYTGTTQLEIPLTIITSAPQEDSVLNVEGSNLTLTYENPQFSDGYGRMNVPNLKIAGGNYISRPVYRLVVSGALSVEGVLQYGSSDPDFPCRIDVYGIFNTHYHDVLLRNCSLYLYTNNINVQGDLEDYGSTQVGEVHVLTTFVGDTLGGHAVIKDLTLS